MFPKTDSEGGSEFTSVLILASTPALSLNFESGSGLSRLFLTVRISTYFWGVRKRNFAIFLHRSQSCIKHLGQHTLSLPHSYFRSALALALEEES